MYGRLFWELSFHGAYFGKKVVQLSYFFQIFVVSLSRLMYVAISLLYGSNSWIIKIVSIYTMVFLFQSILYETISRWNEFKIRSYKLKVFIIGLFDSNIRHISRIYRLIQEVVFLFWYCLVERRSFTKIANIFGFSRFVQHFTFNLL